MPASHTADIAMIAGGSTPLAVNVMTGGRAAVEAVSVQPIDILRYPLFWVSDMYYVSPANLLSVLGIAIALYGAVRAWKSRQFNPYESTPSDPEESKNGKSA